MIDDLFYRECLMIFLLGVIPDMEKYGQIADPSIQQEVEVDRGKKKGE